MHKVLLKQVPQIQVCVVLFEERGSPHGSPHGSPPPTTIAAGYLEEDY